MVITKPPVKGMARKGRRKGKKEVFDAEEANIQREATIVAEQRAPSWGILEPVHQILELVRPLITSQVIIVVLFVLLVYSWFLRPGRGTSIGYQSFSSPARIAAYEEIWNREESALWDWLEDRVGLEGGYAPPLSSQQQERQKVLRARNVGKGLDNEHMSDRQIDEQIRTTEEKLMALKEAVERRKTQTRGHI